MIMKTEFQLRMREALQTMNSEEFATKFWTESRAIEGKLEDWIKMTPIECYKHWTILVNLQQSVLDDANLNYTQNKSEENLNKIKIIKFCIGKSKEMQNNYAYTQIINK